MAATTIFPPQIATYMPAVLINGDDNIKVTFSLTDYNNRKEITGVVYSLVGQNSNTSVIQDCLTGMCPIFCSDNGIENFPTVSDKNDILIYDSSTKMFTFYISQLRISLGLQPNTYYQLQVKFIGQFNTDSAEASLDDLLPLPSFTSYESATDDNIQDWLASAIADYSYCFSEWSTVCLLHGISNYTTNINNFSTQSTNTVSARFLLVDGSVSFDNSDNEKIKSCVMVLKEESKTLLTSGNVMTNTYLTNNFSYNFKYSLANNHTYTLVISYITSNLYEFSESYKIKVEQNISTENSGIEYQELKYLLSGASIHMVLLLDKDKARGEKHLVIRRASNLDNFTYWSIVHEINIDINGKITYLWDDYTVLSGRFYEYKIDRINSDGSIILSDASDPVYVDMEDMFLINEDGQLKIRFNPEVTNFKYVTQDSVTNTFGSAYPFIRRNGATMYRQFSIGGLISATCDAKSLSLTPKKMYDQSNDLYLTQSGLTAHTIMGESDSINNNLNLYTGNYYYNIYNKWYIELILTSSSSTSFTPPSISGIQTMRYNDYTYLRLFRLKVMAFLYDISPKLFRSSTEGNILVSLTNVTFTPKKELGRMVYEFSAQANEINTATILNLDYYNIINTSLLDADYLYVLKTMTYDNVENVAVVNMDELIKNVLLDDGKLSWVPYLERVQSMKVVHDE